MLNYPGSTYHKLSIAYPHSAASILCGKLPSQLHFPTISFALAFNQLWHDYAIIKPWSVLAFVSKVILSEVQKKTKKSLPNSCCSLVLSVSAIAHQNYVIFFRNFTCCEHVCINMCRRVYACVHFFMHKKCT
uniref:Uncharacterized protein n=1 Tax=Rhipicephalus zambeziensis TaxID=60191 RepID=A0A224Y574_9ACAR